MRVVYGGQMRSIEEAAINDWQIPGLLLMENAAMGAAEYIFRLLRSKRSGGERAFAGGTGCGKRVAVVCGPGNNGGDGLAVARLLTARQIETVIIFVGDLSAVKNDARTNLDIVRRMGIPLLSYPSAHEEEAVHAVLKGAALLVDALFGTGLTRAPEGIYAEIIEMMNESGRRVWSLDIPSGVNADNGQVAGAAVQAQGTITFGWMKAGLLLYPGAALAGRVRVVPLSLPPEARIPHGPELAALTAADIPAMLPRRPKDSHKGSYGRVRVMAGSRNMPGAAVIACRAAYKAGAGLVEACVIAEVAQVIQAHLPEAITTVLPENAGRGCLAPLSDLFPEAKALGLTDGSRAAAAPFAGEVWLIGPGLGRGAAVTDFVRTALGLARCPVVLDADGLNAVAQDLSLLRQIGVPCVITPHPGEMHRLTGLSVREITADPVTAATEFARKQGVVTLLKGSRSVIADSSGKAYLNLTGTQALAKAGAGDALAGIIAGLMAQGLEAFDAAALGGYLHGQAGERAGEKLSLYGVNAHDIIDALPEVMRRYQ